MAKLSGRLKLIADNIEKGQAMADIGTDHGFLPFYLCKKNECPKVILTDISEVSLEKARLTMEVCPEDVEVIFRVGDGLNVLTHGEVDVVVLAGMGSMLIIRILEENIKKTLSFDGFILQPRNLSGKLRFWLHKAGFEIKTDGLAMEGKFICEVLTVKPPNSIEKLPPMEEYQGEPEYELPSLCGELYIEFAEKKLSVEKRILQELIEGKVNTTETINKTQNRIKFFEEKIKEVSLNENG